jgi:ribosome biogenesis GTPase
LKRKTAGKKIDFQLIAANIDTAFIIQSLDEDFSLRRLERYLTMVNESHIRPMILLSKSDLIPPEAVEAYVQKAESVSKKGVVFRFSNKTGEGLNRIKQQLQPAKTYCLLGSSGVGKTTLLNHLIGTSQFTTRSVRQKDSKGRHTTTNRLLIQLDNGAMMIDSPGMRELGIFSSDTGFDETFSDIERLTQQCRFNNCSHVNQKGCAVEKALRSGELNRQRYLNFIQMKKEADFYEMSYVEKRKKDKQFTKMVKTVTQYKKKFR